MCIISMMFVLAARTEVGASSSQGDLQDGCPADAALEAGSSEDPELSKVVTLSHQPVTVQAEARSSMRDRFAKHSSNAAMKSICSRTRKLCLCGMDTGAMQRLIHVDVAESSDDTLIEKPRLQSRPTRTHSFSELCSIELSLQWLRAHSV